MQNKEEQSASTFDPVGDVGMFLFILVFLLYGGQLIIGSITGN